MRRNRGWRCRRLELDPSLEWASQVPCWLHWKRGKSCCPVTPPEKMPTHTHEDWALHLACNAGSSYVRLHRAGKIFLLLPPLPITTHQPDAMCHSSAFSPCQSEELKKNKKIKNHQTPSGSHSCDQIWGHFLSVSWQGSVPLSGAAPLALGLGSVPRGQCPNYWHLCRCCASGPGPLCGGCCAETNAY